MSTPENNLSIIELPVSLTKIVSGMEVFTELKQKILSEVDKQKIGDKIYIKRSGWRKLAFAFNISDEIIKSEKELLADNAFVWRIWVKTTAPNNRYVVGIGSCSSNERAFAHVEHDVYATAHTRAKNRAISDILGSGEVSAEEMGDKTTSSFKGFETGPDSKLKKS